MNAFVANLMSHPAAAGFQDEENFIYLRYNWISTSLKLLETCQALAESCRVSRGKQQQVYTDFAPAFNVVLTSLEVSGAYTPNQWIRIVTDRDVYGCQSQRSPAHNRKVQTALKWLIDEAYLSYVDGDLPPASRTKVIAVSPQILENCGFEIHRINQ